MFSLQHINDCLQSPLINASGKWMHWRERWIVGIKALLQSTQMIHFRRLKHFYCVHYPFVRFSWGTWSNQTDVDSGISNSIWRIINVKQQELYPLSFNFFLWNVHKKNQKVIINWWVPWRLNFNVNISVNVVLIYRELAKTDD